MKNDTIELTKEEANFVMTILSKVTIPALADDAVECTMLSRSIAKKCASLAKDDEPKKDG